MGHANRTALPCWSCFCHRCTCHCCYLNNRNIGHSLHLGICSDNPDNPSRGHPDYSHTPCRLNNHARTASHYGSHDTPQQVEWSGLFDRVYLHLK